MRMTRSLSTPGADRLKRAVVVTALVLVGCATGDGKAGAVDIQVDDVALFYRVYDAASGHPSAAQLQHDYLDAGSDGLRTFASLRGLTAQRLADAIAQQPALYVGARRCAASLERAKPRLAAALEKLRAIYPAARLPPVTITIGRGRPVGIGSPSTGLQIGLEAMCGTTYMDDDVEDRFVHVVAHEYVHVQQPKEIVDDPDPTVLEGSIMEGAAEFVGELVSGGVSFAHQADSVRGREAALEAAFAADIDKRDLSDWLYNGSIDRAGNLGYWVGYRICKRYYDHAVDKRAAVREIIEMRDPEAFLARSGWAPGVRS